MATAATSAHAVAGPSTPSWNSSHFYIDMDSAPALSPSLPISVDYTRCSSEPPQNSDSVPRPRSRSRSVSRTPSLPPSGDSRTDLKSLPATPKVQTPRTAYATPDNTHAPATAAGHCDPACPLNNPPDTPGGLSLPTSAPGVLGLQDVDVNVGVGVGVHAVPVSVQVQKLPPQTGSEPRHIAQVQVQVQPQRYHKPYTHPSKHTSEALNSTEYTDLFLLEPHEYDSITDGELVRLYDRGVIDGRLLEQIVDASIRIQRACTVADRAVSIKTRRAMIRHALEE